MNIKVRLILKAKKDFGTTKVGETLTLYNNVFDAMTGIAFYPIDRAQWALVAYDLFTGMKGDGQHEIYEGDICRYNTARNGSTIGTIVYEQQACAFWFKWHDGATHRYRELKVNFSDGELWLNDNIEVIGNIYENAGLLAVAP